MIFLILIIGNFVAGCCLLGEKSIDDDILSISWDKLVKNPSEYLGKLVKITTKMKIVQVDYEALWIIVEDPDSSIPQLLFVKGNEKWFHFPLDIQKKTYVEMEGYFNLFDFSNNNLLLTPFSVLELNATSVNLVNESCKYWVNQIKIVDIEKEELNVPSAGAGKVCLKQSETEPLHSTEHSIEMINVVKGCVTLRLKRGDYFEEHKICDGFTAYIPSGTPHMLINYDTEIGCYIYVHAVVDTNFNH